MLLKPFTKIKYRCALIKILSLLKLYASVMKVRLFIAFLLLSALLPVAKAQDKEYSFVDAADLTLTGRLFEDVGMTYHRVDTGRFDGLTQRESQLVMQSSGIAVAFRSDSPSISFIPEYGRIEKRPNTADMSVKGFDLYIRDVDGRYGSKGQWVYVKSHSGRHLKAGVIKDNMDTAMKEFLLYLPTYSEVISLKIGVEKGYVLEKLPNPFRHRVGVFGSSFTQGASTTRSGMTWPAQFSRMTGVQLLSLGCNGNCKLQMHFADILAAADVDALVFDAFSNPGPELIEENLFPFIERIRKSHPDIPLIFQQTIYRETRNFDPVADKKEKEKRMMAERMMKEAMRKYDNVYFVFPNVTTPRHDTSVDGIHPTDYGYYLWAESVVKPVMRILRKYGIE